MRARKPVKPQGKRNFNSADPRARAATEGKRVRCMRPTGANRRGRRDQRNRSNSASPLVHNASRLGDSPPADRVGRCVRVAALGYVARDFLIPTAGAVVPGARPDAGRQHFRAPAHPALPVRRRVRRLLAMGLALLLAISIPALTNWIDQTPYLTYTLQRKLEGVRKSIAVVQEVSKQVEEAASAATPSAPAAAPPEKVVVREKSLMAELASNTPGCCCRHLLCRGAGLPAARPSQQLAATDHAHPCVVQYPGAARPVMRDINERVGHYLFSLAVILHRRCRPARRSPSLCWAFPTPSSGVC